jgi:outer membrane protein
MAPLKLLCPLLGATLLLLAPAASAQQPPAAGQPAVVAGQPAGSGVTKVATIDLQKAINDTNEGQRATDTLKRLFEKHQVELNQKQETLYKERAALAKKCKTLGQAQCQAGMEELEHKMADLQNLMVGYQQDIQKRQGETTQSILLKMLAIVRRLAGTGGYDLVVEKNAAPFFGGSELTEAAVKLYNTESGIAPLPPEAPAKATDKPARDGKKAKK